MEQIQILEPDTYTNIVYFNILAKKTTIYLVYYYMANTNIFCFICFDKYIYK